MNRSEKDRVLAIAMGVITVGLLVILGGLIPLLATGQPLTTGPTILCLVGAIIMVSGISWWFSERR